MHAMTLRVPSPCAHLIVLQDDLPSAHFGHKLQELGVAEFRVCVLGQCLCQRPRLAEGLHTPS